MIRRKPIDLIRAVFEAGFRCGYQAGGDNATAYERGACQHSPKSGRAAWEADVQWRLETDSSYKLDPGDVDGWNNIP